MIWADGGRDLSFNSAWVDRVPPLTVFSVSDSAPASHLALFSRLVWSINALSRRMPSAVHRCFSLPD